jgi:phage tail sheath protein FI
MPITPTYPGVYIEEVPSGVRPITGVATSIGAFIGFFSRGPFGEARRLLSAADFDREYGGLRPDSLASYAIQQFFLNGGQQAWVVRTAAGTPTPSSIEMQDQGGTAVFRVLAVSEGVWGDNLRVDVDYGTADPANTFNLTVSEIVNGNVVNSESFLNLTITPGDRRFAVDVIGDSSKLIRLEAIGTPTTRPAPTGTVSAAITDVSALPLTGQLNITIGAANGGPVPLGSTPATMAALRGALQAAIRAANPAAFARVTVSVAGTLASGAFLHVRTGSDDPATIVQLSGQLATDLGFAGTAQQNVQQYALGSATTAGKQVNGGPGDDGTVPGAQELIDALPAFDPVDLINILCIPDTDQLADTDANQVAASATAYVANRRAFYIVDPPNLDLVRDDIPEIEAWLDGNGTLRHQNAAVYFPRPMIADPLNEFRLRAVPASGTIAGLYARIDGERGVWKAPAGLEAVLRGVQRLEYVMTDDENGVLNPIAINALRTFRTSGNVCWGARTLVGADLLASEWKYIPVRRLALFLEESLYRGTQFAVFEPNDEPLWSQIRLNVGAFMQSLFLQGAFQGQTPRQAYLVKCDSETTTQDDINHGIVNIIVGFAPLKPAEFVIIRIRQLAGQTQA